MDFFKTDFCEDGLVVELGVVVVVVVVVVVGVECVLLSKLFVKESSIDDGVEDADGSATGN